MQTETATANSDLAAPKQSSEDSEPTPLVAPDQTALNGRFNFWIASTALLAVILAMIAYRAAAANYFTGDDFVYLHWLRTAWAEPVKLWTVLWSNSLDASSTYFYRPLLSLSMALDKAVWGSNALGFHATNLFFHAVCSVLIYFYTRDVLLPKHSTKTLQLWPVLAASFFLLHPLHPEVVTWIGGRVDTVATAFFIGTMYSFARWRSGHTRFWFRLAVSSFILCLCSKELAIMLPAALFAFDWILPNNPTTRANSTTEAAHGWLYSYQIKLRSAVANTYRFWALLAVYFVVRRISLGTFVGGYDNSLSVGPDLQEFAVRWMNSIAFMLVPVNQTLANRVPLQILIWIALTAVVLISLFKVYIGDKELRKTINFLFATTLITLVPVYKLMSISGDMESSRLAYLATAPLSCLLALGCCSIIFAKGRMLVVWIASLSYLLLAASCLNLNNLAWQRAGKASNSIQSTFAELEKNHIPSVIVLGLPDNLNGAYVCRNALGQMHDDSLNVIPLSAANELYSTAFTKEALAKAGTPTVLAFSADSMSLKPVHVPHASMQEPRTFSGKELQTLFVKNVVDSQGLHVDDALPKSINLPVSRSSIDAVIFRIRVSTLAATAMMPPGNLGLFFNNALTGSDAVPGQEMQVAQQTRTGANSENREDKEARGDRYIVFPMRGHANWQLDAEDSHTLSLLSGSPWTGTIKSVSFVPLKTIAPAVSFAHDSLIDEHSHPGSPQQLGLLTLSKNQKNGAVHIDASKVPGADKLMVEISRRDIAFKNPNSATLNDDEFPKKMKFGSTIADAHFSLTDFEQRRAIYTLRAWALDASNKPIGVASDHVDISIED